MITEYERKQCDHPIIKEILLWHDEAWLDGKQLEALLGISRSKLKRLLQRIHTESEIDYHHSEVFSVVRQRYHKGKQKKVIGFIKFAIMIQKWCVCWRHIAMKALSIPFWNGWGKHHEKKKTVSYWLSGL